MDERSPTTAPGAAPTENERTWGMLAHLSALVGLVFPLVGNILGPLLVWLSKRDQSAFIATQAKEALNFNITVTLAGVVCGFLALIFIGFLLVMTLLAAIRASEGVVYHYPVSVRLVK